MNHPPPATGSGYCKSDLQRPHAYFFITLFTVMEYFETGVLAEVKF